MASTSTNPSNHTFNFRSLLEREKLNETNFLDWFRNLRIILTQEEKMYVFDGPLPSEPASNASRTIRDAYVKHKSDARDVQCLMLATMDSTIQKNFEFHGAYETIIELKSMFQKQARQELYDTFQELVNCKMQEGKSVSAHVLKMKGLIERLNRLGLPFGNDLATFTVLGSLPKSFNQFVMHYNMNGWDKPIMELHAMLVTAEKNISAKPTQVLMVKGGHIKKKNAKAKGKWQGGKGKAKVKGPGPKTTTQQPKKATKNPNCFNCGEPGHWKRDCPKPLTEAKKTSDGGIFVIELYAFSNNSWVFDTGCGTHICNDLQVLRKARELREGQMVLHVGNGANVTVEAVGEVSLLLPNGL